jgi:hypothetical protein
MSVRIYTAGDYKLHRGIDGAIGFHIQLPSDDRDLFVLNQDVRGIIIDRCNNPAILY